jgi:hexosaminidase
MPGHSIAALASYPYLGCTGGPYEVRPDRGITRQVYCAGREETYQFIFNLLDEVLELFPSPFIHIGGDECPKEEWAACADCQARIRQENLQDEKELQSYFIHRVDDYLTQRGRRLIGWDEILEGGLAPGAVVQAWRDVEHAKAAAMAGHDVILSPTSHCYLDYTYEKISTELAHSYEAVLEELTAQQQSHILGIEGNTWSEEVPDQDKYDYQTYPRLSALAEVAWSPASQRTWSSFSMRLDVLKQRLEVLGVKYGEEQVVSAE